MTLLPRENPLLIGHDKAERRFLNAWQSDRIPHAWLISGPEGIGKATLSYRIARFILLKNTKREQPQNSALLEHTSSPRNLEVSITDPIFRKIASGGHPDLLTIERTQNEKDNRLKSNISVDEIRSCISFLRLTPAEAGWRVLIVDSADDLSINAANALLKILEEPTPRTLILLTVNRPLQLLATIRSRCCTLKLRPLSNDDLVHVIQQSKLQIEPKDRENLVNLSSGSPGRALTFAEENILVLFNEFLALLENFPQIDAEKLHKLADKLSVSGEEKTFSLTMELICSWLSSLIKNASLGKQHPGQQQSYNWLTENGVDRLVELWEKIEGLSQRAIHQSLDRKHIILTIFGLIKSTAKA